MIPAPAATHAERANMTGLFPSCATHQMRKAARTANIVPLKGFPDSQATTLTDRSGATRTRPSSRARGRQPANSAKNNPANIRCHPMASQRQSFAIDPSSVSNASGEGTTPPDIVNARSLPNGVSRSPIVLRRIGGCGADFSSRLRNRHLQACILKPQPRTNEDAAVRSYLATLMQDYHGCDRD